MVRPRHDPLPDPIPASYYALPPAGPPPARRWRPLRDAVAGVRGWPVERQVGVGVAALVGVACAAQLPWRPALGLFGLLALAATALAVDALGVRGRLPLLGSRDPVHVLAGWGVVGGLLATSAIIAVVATLAGQGGLGPPAGAAASSASSSAAPGARPTTTPVMEETPLPLAGPPSPTPTATPTPGPTPSATPHPSPTLSPVTFRNAPLSVRRGARPVTLRAQATPGTACSIAIGYPGAPDLGPATTDAGGGVSWTWRVSGDAPTGSWPVTVTCAGASATTRIVVS